MNTEALIKKWQTRIKMLNVEFQDCVREHDFISANNYKGAIDAIEECIKDVKQSK